MKFYLRLLLRQKRIPVSPLPHSSIYVNLVYTLYTMARKYREWTYEDLKLAVETSVSLAEVLRKLNLRPTGGNYHNINRNIAQLNLNTSHFTGKVWNKDLFIPIGNLKDRKAIKKSLIKSKGNTCQNCNSSTWLDKKIPLEVHHIDGNKVNNSEINLQLLCPNCHALTANYRNRKR
jgi:hypothetical protein